MDFSGLREHRSIDLLHCLHFQPRPHLITGPWSDCPKVWYTYCPASALRGTVPGRIGWLFRCGELRRLGCHLTPNSVNRRKSNTRATLRPRAHFRQRHVPIHGEQFQLQVTIGRTLYGPPWTDADREGVSVAVTPFDVSKRHDQIAGVVGRTVLFTAVTHSAGS